MMPKTDAEEASAQAARAPIPNPVLDNFTILLRLL
jgi:hypothetical protein